MLGLSPTSEIMLRLLVALAVFALLAAWEANAPRRRQEVPRRLRWINNLALLLLNTTLVRMILPAAAVGLAALAGQRGWGLFNVLHLPLWSSWIVSLLLLDLFTYLQHVLFHVVPPLWRFHRMHHSDLEFDVTTGIRFHPVEILLSVAIRLAVILTLGAPAGAVLVFEILLNATSLFNHSNVYIPLGVDRLLRRLVVTPDMHRIHHSARREETDSNFGFNLSCWDRLFRTYRAAPEGGHQAMIIGLEQFRSLRDLRLDRMLVQPLMGAAHEPARSR